MLVTCFHKGPASVALNARITLRSETQSLQKEGTVTSYYEAVNYLLETYATDDVITKTDADMMSFTQPSSKLPTECAEALWNIALRCEQAYDEYEPKGFLLRNHWHPSGTVCSPIGVQRNTLQYTSWRSMQLR